MRSTVASTSHPAPPSRAERTLHDPRWPAVLARDPTATFFFSVSTTGIVCRPSCPARRPRPEHVTFHGTLAEALALGLRPCQRCHPEAPPHARELALVTRLCRLLGRGPMPLAELARRARLSPSYLHRLFRAHTGLTPRQFALARRRESTLHQLAHAPTITEALYNAGFNSSSRFYSHTSKDLGMTPSAHRAGAPGLAIAFATTPCSLGTVLVAQTSRGLCAILLGDAPEALRSDLSARFPHATLVSPALTPMDPDTPRDHPASDPNPATIASEPAATLAANLRTVIALIDDPTRAHHLPLDLQGTAFQQRVWQALQTIPPGTTTTYSELAARLGQPSATRAVAGACAANPLAVAVPCHRVLRADGTPSGYRWGLPRKQTLLTREQSPPQSAIVPLIS